MTNEPIDTKNVKLYSIKERNNKVKLNDFARGYEKSSSFESFIDGLPSILKANDLIEFTNRIIEARKKIKLLF